VKGLSAVADERRRTDKLDGVIKHRSSRETTMVGRGASLDGRLFLCGTDGSNPVPSASESYSQSVPKYRRKSRGFCGVYPSHRCGRPRLEPPKSPDRWIISRRKLKVPFPSSRWDLLGEFGEIPVEVDHDLANLVLPAYRLSERGETPGSTVPANRSQ